MALPINQQQRSVVEPIIDRFLERVTEIPEPTISNLIEEIMNLLVQPMIDQHEQAQSVLEGRLKLIRRKNSMEPLGGEEQEFFNFSQHLIDKQGKVNEICLKHLKQIPLTPSFETEEAFEARQIEVREKHLFKRLKGFLSIPDYQRASIEILRAPSLYTFTPFLAKETSGSQLLSLAQALIKTDETLGKEIIKNHFPPFENTPPKMAFGKAEWEKYFGDVGEEPPLPIEVSEILKSPCPYWDGQKIEETHILVLIPKMVNGKPFTIGLLEELVKNPNEGGHATKCYIYDSPFVKVKELKDRGISSSYWALITRDMIPNSRNKKFSDQQCLLKKHYAVPKALELATGVLMHYVQTGEKLYPDQPNTYSRCQEMDSTGYLVVVGSLGSSGLLISNSYSGCNAIRGEGTGYGDRGLGGVRTLYVR